MAGAAGNGAALTSMAFRLLDQWEPLTSMGDFLEKFPPASLLRLVPGTIRRVADLGVVSGGAFHAAGGDPSRLPSRLWRQP